MSRLTDAINGANVLILNNNNGGKYNVKQYPDNTYSIQGDAVDKLAEYEKLEEQGLLLRLPCNVGDAVYDKKLNKLTVTDICIGEDVCIHAAKDRSNSIWTGMEFGVEDFRKIVFLTREEAEQALEKLNENSNER